MIIPIHIDFTYPRYTIDRSIDRGGGALSSHERDNKERVQSDTDEEVERTRRRQRDDGRGRRGRGWRAPRRGLGRRRGGRCGRRGRRRCGRRGEGLAGLELQHELVLERATDGLQGRERKVS